MLYNLTYLLTHLFTGAKFSSGSSLKTLGVTPPARRPVGIFQSGPNEGFYRQKSPSKVQGKSAGQGLGNEVPQKLKVIDIITEQILTLMVVCLTHLWFSFNFRG